MRKIIKQTQMIQFAGLLLAAQRFDLHNRYIQDHNIKQLINFVSFLESKSSFFLTLILREHLDYFISSVLFDLYIHGSKTVIDNVLI